MAEEPTTPTTPPPSQRHRLPLGYYANWAAAEARRFRRELTRENFQAFLKNMAWVVPLTLLIWVYAEREETDKQPNVAIHLNVTARQPDKIISIDNPPERLFQCELSGPRSQLDQIRAMSMRELTVQLDVTGNASQLQIQVLPHIQDDPLFKGRGISVTSVVPETMQVSVDTEETQELTIKAPPTLSEIVQATTFVPSTIKIHGPSRALANLQPPGVIFADLSSIPNLHTPGQHAEQNVTLIPPSPDSHVTLSQESVLATFSVRENEVVYVPPPDKQSLGVEIMTPYSISNKYDITYDEAVTNFKLIGPKEGIDKIDPNLLVAVLELDNDDIQKPSGVKAVRIVMLPDLTLPDGVHMAPDSAPTVKYQATLRQQ